MIHNLKEEGIDQILIRHMENDKCLYVNSHYFIFIIRATLSTPTFNSLKYLRNDVKFPSIANTILAVCFI